VIAHRRDHDPAVEVEHQNLLRVRRLRHDVPQDGPHPGTSRCHARVAGSARKHLAHVASEAARCPGLESSEQPGDKHHVPSLLVDPAVEGVCLQLFGGVQTVEDERLERAPRAQVRDGADDADHQQRQREERQHESRDQAAPPEPAQRTFCSIVER
jgi:hypothetical protein